MTRIPTVAATLLLSMMISLPALAQKPQRPSRQFVQMDKNADGDVTWPELKRYYPNSKVSYFQTVDLNKDHKISHEEWYQFRDKSSPKRPPDEPRNNGRSIRERPDRPSAKPRATQFKRLDTDNNEELSYEELKSQVDHIQRSQFKKADTNGNGTLDHNEWAGSREQFGFGIRNNKSRINSRP